MTQQISELTRKQLQIISLEDKIAVDNPVLSIESFVECIPFEALCFTAQKKRTLNPLAILSKLYDYCIVPASDRFSRKNGTGCSTLASLFVMRTQRSHICWQLCFIEIKIYFSNC